MWFSFSYAGNERWIKTCKKRGHKRTYFLRKTTRSKSLAPCKKECRYLFDIQSYRRGWKIDADPFPILCLWISKWMPMEFQFHKHGISVSWACVFSKVKK